MITSQALEEKVPGIPGENQQLAQELNKSTVQERKLIRHRKIKIEEMQVDEFCCTFKSHDFVSVAVSI